MARIGLIVNPGAGGHLGREAIAAELARHGVEVVDGGDASAERLAVAGGDGSIGPAAADAAARGIPLALIPAGTANDFARALALPGELEAACALAARGGRTRRLDLGRLDGRPFVNVASAGLAPVAAREARGLKRRLGAAAYAAGALRAALTCAPVACRVNADGADVHAGRAWQVTVAVSGAFGGGAGIDEADPADACLDVVVVRAGNRARLAAYGLAMRAGRIAGRRDVIHVRAREVELTLPPGAELNVDGELVRTSLARVTLEPRAFALVVR